MTEPIRARHVHNAQLEVFGGKVTDDGGELRLLSGSDYGLVTSVMYARITPGSGPRRHRHPHAELFVLHGGKGRYEVEGTSFDAEPGDIVIVPPDAWHSFLNIGDGLLQQTAIHQSPRWVTIYEDGSSRD